MSQNNETSLCGGENMLPIINGRILRVHGIRKRGRKRDVLVEVHDRGQEIEYSFKTYSVVVRGVDLRVHGNGINVVGNSIKIQEPACQGSSAYKLTVKGSSMSIDGVRSEGIEKITLSDDYKLKVVIEEPPKEVSMPKRNMAWMKSIGYSFKFFLLLGVLGALTFLPFSRDDYISEKYKELRKLFPVAVVKDANKPAAVSSMLSQQIEGTTSETNRITVTSTSTSSAVDPSDVMQEKQTQGGGIITFYFVTACLLYVLFYFLIMLLTFATFKAMRRHNKMTRNMRPVIEALRNERDKDKRKAMQRKILDDMINTYLDKPASED